MHLHQAEFILAVSSVFPEFFHGTNVLEIGSYNVNGSVRRYFRHPKRYVGVDLIEGPDVDVVCSGEVFESEELFDVSVSTECFEHTPAFLEIFENMTRLTKPGGMVLMSCATTGRPEHGTARTTPFDSPGTSSQEGEDANYYRNLTRENFPDIMLETAFLNYRFFTNREICDLYFVGIKYGGVKPWDSMFDSIAKNAHVDML